MHQALQHHSLPTVACSSGKRQEMLLNATTAGVVAESEGLAEWVTSEARHAHRPKD